MKAASDMRVVAAILSIPLNGFKMRITILGNNVTIEYLSIPLNGFSAIFS